jgi:putative hydrolase of the HAD superfamily
MKKAVYFDLDNTLIHRNKSIDVYAAVFYKEFEKRLKKKDISEIANIIKTQDNGGYLDEASRYTTIKDAVSNELHKHLPWSLPPSVNDIKTYWHRRFPECSIPMQDAEKVLETLSESQCHIGIISNGAHDTRVARAKTLKTYSVVDQLVSSESAGIKKPNSEIFTNTITEAGFKPEQCWYVGDHPINDIEGARNAGITTIWMKGFHNWPKDIKPADHTIEYLSEILDLLSLDSSESKQGQQ